MEFGVLGPLRASAGDGTEVPLGGPKQRSVLALLLVDADRVVGVDRIVEELWPEAISDGSRKTVQAYVSRLRSAFFGAGATEIITARPGGYCLRTDGHVVDAARFEVTLTAARNNSTSDPAATIARLDASLASWRGQPFEDAYATPRLEREAERLLELRLDALEVRAGAQLAAGLDGEILAELRSLAQANPTRERLWEYLLLALYRSGRQSEAATLYVDIARMLQTEYGIDPGPGLNELQRRILQQDPSLIAPVPAAPQPESAQAAPPPDAARSKRASPARLFTIMAAIGLAAAALATSTMLRTWTPDDGHGVAIGATYDVPRGASDIVAVDGRIWVLVGGSSSLTALDPALGTTTPYDVGVQPSAIAAGLGDVWVASESTNALLRIDGLTGSVIGRVDGVDVSGARLIVGTEDVWLIREHALPFVRIDPDGLRVEVLSFVDGFGGPDQPSLAVESGVLWGANAYIGRILSLDPVTGTFDFAGDPRSGEHAVRSILADRGAIWYSQPTAGTVTRLDAETGEVSALADIGTASSAGFGRLVPGYALAAGPGGIWAALPRDRKVVLLDDRNARVLAQVELERPTSVTANRGRVWVLDDGSNKLVELLPGTCDPIPEIVPGADLRGCDLRAKAFVGADLSGADLRWSDLRLAAMQSTDLRGADLFGATMTGAALEGAQWGATRCPDGSLSDSHGGYCPERS